MVNMLLNTKIEGLEEATEKLNKIAALLNELRELQNELNNIEISLITAGDIKPVDT